MKTERAKHQTAAERFRVLRAGAVRSRMKPHFRMRKPCLSVALSEPRLLLAERFRAPAWQGTDANARARAHLRASPCRARRPVRNLKIMGTSPSND